MTRKNKILIKKAINQDKYNELDIEKSVTFLDNLQDFIVDTHLAKINPGEYEFDGKSYDRCTFYTLFYEDPKNNLERRKLSINEFGDGMVVRYFSKDVELLIIFLTDKIKLIFYCNPENRRRIMNSLLKFSRIMKAEH